VSALIHFVDVHVLSNWEEAGNHTLAMKYANCTTSLALSTLKPGIHHSKHTYSLYMSNSICNCQWSMKHCRDFVSEFVHFWPETNTSWLRPELTPGTRLSHYWWNLRAKKLIGKHHLNITNSMNVN